MQDKNNYIITESTVSIRFISSSFLRGKSYKYYLGILLFFILLEAMANILGAVFPASYYDPTTLDLPAEVIAQMPNMPYISVAYTIVLAGAFEFGRTLYQLSFLRNGNPNYEYVFEGFSFFIKSFLLSTLRTVIITTGLLLFIAPGVIALYYYRQAFFILAEDPKKGVIQCMKESRQMMSGNKMSLFRLDFSFVLIYLIANIPVNLMATSIDNTVVGMITYTLFRLPVYVVLANMYFARTVYYELLVSHGFKNFRYKAEDIFRSFDQMK